MAIIIIEGGKIVFKSMSGYLNPSVTYQLIKNYNEDGSVSGKVYHERV